MCDIYSNIVDALLCPFGSCMGRDYDRNEKYKNRNTSPKQLSIQELYEFYHPNKNRPDGHFIKTQWYTDTHGNVHEYRRCSALRHYK